MRIAIVAGETSGDMLGSGLIAELKKQYPDASFEGIGGPLMEQQGLQSFFPMERLAVMGLFEILGRLFEIIKIRRFLVKHWLQNPPDVFIGIDAPDFNLGLEEKLKNVGIKTVHYVSPSVWMWRQKRIFKIARAVDLMLTLFPFEAQFYKDHKVPVACVGHHLADKIPLTTSNVEARKILGLQQEFPVVCLMPGSRAGEVSKLGQIFLDSAKLMLKEMPGLQFVIPAANAERKLQIEAIIAVQDQPLAVIVVDGQSQQCMAAADAILIASGTATLEGMLIKRPMVVSYVVSNLTYQVVKRMVTRPWVSLPNLLANKELIPELLQDDATPEKLAKAILGFLQNPAKAEELSKAFTDIHLDIKRDADKSAALAITQLLQA